jgi:dGTPase
MKEFKIFAAKVENSNRVFIEKPHEIRNEFDRDRDRILYSKAFRRLSGKTQVFLVGNDDHIRTRLTHTLEVAQIANTISKYLGFDETLTEAISLGHDIGHTPFGHVGERTLNYIMNGCYSIKNFNNQLSNNEKGFKHNWQGLRVVSELEQLHKDYFGLNLTDYTVWGILNHSNKKYKPCNRRNNQNTCKLLLSGGKCGNYLTDGFRVNFYNRYESLVDEDSWTIEALVVSLADEIAQRHHDIEDGIEAKIINVSELIDVFEEYFSDYLNGSDKKAVNYIKGEKEKIYYLPALSKLIVNFLTYRLINDTTRNLNEIKKQFNITNEGDFYRYKADIKNKVGLEYTVAYSEDFKRQEKEFQKYLSKRILNSHKVQSMDGKADYIIRKLFKAYTTNPQQLPDKTIITLYRNLLEREEFESLESKHSIESLTGLLRDMLEKDHFSKCEDDYKIILLRTICDYIAGMSDSYAMQQYSQLYGSKRIL